VNLCGEATQVCHQVLIQTRSDAEWLRVMHIRLGGWRRLHVLLSPVLASWWGYGRYTPDLEIGTPLLACMQDPFLVVMQTETHHIVWSGCPRLHACRSYRHLVPA
jgi:hypothetical protein